MQGWELVSSLVATLLGGGLLGVILKYRLDGRKLSKDERKEKREQDRTDFETIMEVLTRQRDEALAREEKTQERLEAVELEVQGLRLVREIDPFPNWIVDLEGRYIYVNREFEKEFLEPLGHGYRWIIGKKHEAIWPAEFAAKLHALDQQARKRPDKKARATAVAGGRQITVHKFPVCVKGVAVAYAGFITDIE